MSEKVFKDDDYELTIDQAARIGSSLGKHAAYEEALVFYKAGEIDFWFEWQRPKTMEEWEEFEKVHGKHKDIIEKYGLPDRD